MLKIFLLKDSQVEDLPCDTSFCSEACLFFSDDLLRLQLQSVEFDLQHDFAWMAEETNCSVVLALCQDSVRQSDHKKTGPL